MRVGTDAFGRAVLDWVEGGQELEIYERHGGHLEAGPGPALYLAPPRRWPAAERQALRLVTGKVLDVGCGAGRVALELQSRGHETLGLDSSPLALRGARRRGLLHTWRAGADDVASRIAGFDTVVLFGNNFGILGTPERTRRTLSAWASAARPGTRLLAESTDPMGGGVPTLGPAACRSPERYGRHVGQVRLRVRYRDLATAWFAWLFVSPAELSAVVAGTGWQLLRLFAPSGAEPFVAVLERA